VRGRPDTCMPDAPSPGRGSRFAVTVTAAWRVARRLPLLDEGHWHLGGRP